MPQGIPQNSFTQGEISPALYGRIDFKGYFDGLRTCRNMIPSKFGGVDNRAGTQFITTVNNSAHSARLIPFQFNNQQQYVLELGNFTMRIIGNGALVSVANVPVVVTTPWAVADLAMLKFTQSADVLTACHPDYPTQQIERLSATSWQVVPFVNVNGPFQDINVNNAITVTANNVTGSVTITASEDLFTADMVGLPFYIKQSPDNTTPAWEVAIVTKINDIVMFGPNYYQAASAGTTGTIGPTVTEGSERDGNPGILWQYLHSGFGIVLITHFTDTKHVTATVQSRIPDSVVAAAIAVNISSVIAGDAGSSLPVQVVTAAPHPFVTGTQVVIAGVVGTLPPNGTFTITVIDTLNFYLNNNFDVVVYTSGGTATDTSVATPTYTWALPAWGSAQGYPSTTTYFQDRQMFGGTNGQPANIFMSTSGGFLDFTVSNPVLDSDAITYKVLSNQVNTIRHMLEMSSMIVLTSGGIYMVQGGTNGTGVITPSTVNLVAQGANPVSDIAPLKIGAYALFIQEKGSQVRTLGYSFAENAFLGQDVTVMSAHLLQFNTIVAWAYQEIPYNVIWAVRDDGVLLSLTFLPEQQITAWAHHDTLGKYESVCCITENNKDVVYFVVNRTIGGQTVRCIERMASRQFQDQRDAFFVDCGLTYDGRPGNTTASTFAGLDHLEGQTVATLADGMVYPQQVVTGGSVTIPNAAQVVHIGLPYVSDFETLDIAVPNGNLRDKKKLINAVSLVVDKSSGFMVGPDANNLQSHKTRSTENYGDPDNLIIDIIDENIPCDWRKSGRIFVRQSKPLPLTILSVIPQVEQGGY